MLNDLLNPESASILVYGKALQRLESLQLLLTQGGFHNVNVVSCHKQALDYFCQQQPDLVLMDITVSSQLTAEELLAQIQSNSPTVPIIVIYEHASRENKLKFLQQGAHDFFNKPLDLNETLCRIRNWLCMHLSHKESLEHYGNLNKLIETRTADLHNTQKEILQRLGVASEYKDADTYLHTIRVGQYAGYMAKSMGFNENIVEELAITAPLHDVGKIGVPDHILFKNGKLNQGEWEQMKLHTVHGYKILKGSDNSLLKSAETIALSHHERWDGKGYPYQLKQTEVHLYGRITAVCDVYDALTMERPYKPAWSHEAAVTKIIDGRGSQFDPELIDVFASVTNEFANISNGELLIK
jgi:cyclic di-GMP phosphodiesterase